MEFDLSAPGPFIPQFKVMSVQTRMPSLLKKLPVPSKTWESGQKAALGAEACDERCHRREPEKDPVTKFANLYP